jgi:hypothetical protein
MRYEGRAGLRTGVFFWGWNFARTPLHFRCANLAQKQPKTAFLPRGGIRPKYALRLLLVPMQICSARTPLRAHRSCILHGMRLVQNEPRADLAHLAQIRVP